MRSERTKSIGLTTTLEKKQSKNIFALRFANSIFEPIWNRNYVDHIQITVAEEVVIGRRAGYYDTSGILRDMFQNHILQLMMITAMEPPAKYGRGFGARRESQSVAQRASNAWQRLCQEHIPRSVRGLLR